MRNKWVRAGLILFAFVVCWWAGYSAFAVAEAEEFAYNEPVNGLLSKMFATSISEVFAVSSSPLLFPGIGFLMLALAVTAAAFTLYKNRITKTLFSVTYLAAVPLGLMSMIFLPAIAFLDGETLEEGWTPLQGFGVFFWLIATAIMFQEIRPRLMRSLQTAPAPSIA